MMNVPVKKLQKDTLIYFISKVIPGLMGLLSTLTFVRLVGIDQYGRYAVTFSFIRASAAGMSGWLSQGILRFDSNYKEAEQALDFKQAIFAGSVLSVGLGGLFVAIGSWILIERSLWISLLGVLLAGVIFEYTVLLSKLQAQLRSGSVARIEGVRSVAAFAIPVVTILASGARNFWILLLGVLGGYLVGLVGQRYLRSVSSKLVGRAVRKAMAPAQRQLLRQVWSYGWPVGVWLFCSQGLSVSDRYLLQHFRGYSDAGVYASMYDVVVRSFSLIFFPITLATTPLIMAHWNSGERGVAVSVIKTSLKYQMIIFCAVFLVLIFAAPWVSRLVLGHGNLAGAPLILPLAVVGFLWQIALLFHKPLELLCQTKRMLIGVAVALAVNVVGNYLLIPAFGYVSVPYVNIAAAMAYLITVAALTPLTAFRKLIAMGGIPMPVDPSTGEFSRV